MAHKMQHLRKTSARVDYGDRESPVRVEFAASKLPSGGHPSGWSLVTRSHPSWVEFTVKMVHSGSHPSGWLLSAESLQPGCNFSAMRVIRKTAITPSIRLRLRCVRYPCKALSKTKTLMTFSEHFDVIWVGWSLVESSCM